MCILTVIGLVISLVWLLILMVLSRSVYHTLVSLFISVTPVTVTSFFFLLIPEIQ